MGAGGLIPLAMAVIGDLIAPRERGKWQGLTGAVFGIASVVGPATGGWISDNASWRWAFFVSLPFGLLALVVVWRGFTMEPAHRSHRVDYVGAALLTAGVSFGLLATVWGGTEYPWAATEIVGLYAACAAVVVAFLFWERRVPEPILPLHLLGNRTFAAAQVALFVTGAETTRDMVVVGIGLGLGMQTYELVVQTPSRSVSWAWPPQPRSPPSRAQATGGRAVSEGAVVLWVLTTLLATWFVSSWFFERMYS